MQSSGLPLTQLKPRIPIKPERTHGDSKAIAFTPADIKEYSNSYVFIIDMPGMKSGDIKVQVEEGNVLLISGERKREEEKQGAKYVRMKRRIGKFMRKFVLPENANADKISAVSEDGVLTVTVEKVPPPQPKIIEVKIAYRERDLPWSLLYFELHLLIQNDDSGCLHITDAS